MKHRHAYSDCAIITRTASLAILVGCALLAGCATTNVAAVAPETLKVPETQVLSRRTHATGVQIYQCLSSKDYPLRFAWIFAAPEAELFDDAGKKIAKHYAGPTWEASDGSKVVGEVIARDNGPDPAAIPWLLLSATSNSGTGIFGRVRSIQRLHTAGGKAPIEGCNPEQAGTEVRVPYTADYWFYVAKS